MRRFFATILGLTVALVLGCRTRNGSETTATSVDGGAVQTTNADLGPSASGDAGFVSAASELASGVVDAGGARSPLAAGELAPGATIAIPAGTFLSGSAPGEVGRVHGLEPALVPATLGAYAIDALPFPDDPSAPPMLVGSASEAAAACASRSAHLCSELEWEHACKGPSDDAFATGAQWNPDCDRSPSRCASGYGARAMGFMPEWTASRFPEAPGGSVLRGGPTSGHRCGARSPSGRPRPRKGEASGSDDGQALAAFRCCHGEPNAATIAPIDPKPAFRRTSIEAAELATIFEDIPELGRLRDGLRLFADADAKTITARSNASAEGITFATSPVLWSPEPGIELLVSTGRARKTSFVVALWVLPPASGNAPRYRFASAFLLLNDAAPLALAYEPSHRKELRWSACWGCAGEQGAVTVHEDGRVVIVQY